MERKLIILAGLVVCLALGACGRNTNPTSDPANTTDASALHTTDSAQDTRPPVAAEAYLCELDNGLSVRMGAEASAAIAALGDCIDYAEAPSCVHEGFDKVYTYNGFTVSTSPDANGREYVSEFSIQSDAVAFFNGVTIGSFADDVTEAFGADFEEQFGVRKYQLQNAVLTLAFDGDTVTAIAVSYTA